MRSSPSSDTAVCGAFCLSLYIGTNSVSGLFQASRLPVAESRHHFEEQLTWLIAFSSADSGPQTAVREQFYLRS